MIACCIAGVHWCTCASRVRDPDPSCKKRIAASLCKPLYIYAQDMHELAALRLQTWTVKVFGHQGHFEQNCWQLLGLSGENLRLGLQKLIRPS